MEISAAISENEVSRPNQRQNDTGRANCQIINSKKNTHSILSLMRLRIFRRQFFGLYSARIMTEKDDTGGLQCERDRENVYFLL